MSTLTLVRHGQAIPFQREAAVLSSLGEAQASRLAQYWLAHGVRFDEVHTGVLVRQTQTERVVAECFREAGQPWPAARCDPSWNEYDAPGVLGRMVPADPHLAVLAAEWKQSRGSPHEKRAFQRMFEAAMLCWVAQAVPPAHPDLFPASQGVEPWPAFRDRVSGAIRRIMEGPSSRRVVVFTSGGAIGCAVQFALKAPARSFLEINWRIRNTAVTEFVFDRERLTLDSFNCLPHIDDPGLRTYR